MSGYFCFQCLHFPLKDAVEDVQGEECSAEKQGGRAQSVRKTTASHWSCCWDSKRRTFHRQVNVNPHNFADWLPALTSPCVCHLTLQKWSRPSLVLYFQKREQQNSSGGDWTSCQACGRSKKKHQFKHGAKKDAVYLALCQQRAKYSKFCRI